MSLLRPLIRQPVSAPISSVIKGIYAPPVTLPTPLAQWPINETSGTTISDTSGGGFHGTYVGTQQFIQDEAQGTILNFLGSNYIDFGDFFYSDVITFSCWIKLTSTTARNIIVKRNAPGVTSASLEYWLRTTTGPVLDYRAYSAGGAAVNAVTGTTVLSLYKWYHVCVVQEGNGAPTTLYLDGVSEGTATQSAVTANTSSLFQLGARTSNSDGTYWSGHIYDCRVYNTALTSQQVQKIYNDTKAYDPRSLITGTPTRWDDFTTLAAAAAVNTRVLPGGGGGWVADAGWIGIGNGTVQSTTNGQAAKSSLTHADCSVRLIWHPGATGDNQVSIFCRDVQSTAFPRYGFLLSTYPAYTSAPPAQAIALYRNDDYVFTRLGTGAEDGFYEATINRGWNVMELRCVGSTISAYLNGTKIIEVTDAAYGTARSRWGFAHTNQSNTDARISYVDFTVLA